jgi:hypothetical protein
LSPMIVRAPYSSAPTSDRSTIGAVERAAAGEVGVVVAVAVEVGAVVVGAGRAPGDDAGGG